MVFMMALSDEGKSVFLDLYHRYYDAMNCIATKILGDLRGEDAVQDVFSKLIEKYENGYDELLGKPKHFFTVAVKNHCVNIKNGNRIDFFDDMEQFAQTQPDIADEVASNDALEYLEAYIQKLPPKTRQIFEYRYILEYSNKEIAAEMGISERNVSMQLVRAKEKLRKLMQKEAGRYGA
jgi:RNA polymerase sigma-70 factor (ECF subfamily)